MNGVPIGGEILAHGIGGRQDLPIPVENALGGAVVALIATFVILGKAWRTSRFRGAKGGRPLPAAVQRFADARATRLTLRVIGLLLGVYTIVQLLAGPEQARDNPAPGVLYVLLWVGVPLASLLFGPVWRLINPIRSVHAGLARLAGQPPERGMRPAPTGWGLWPGAIMLFAFVWLELVAPERATLPIVGLAFAAYTVVTLLGALLYGSGWIAQADPFEVFSTLAARLSAFGRRDDGKLVVRNPFDGLDATPAVPGLAAVVMVLLGSTAYDSLSNDVSWVTFVQTSDLSPVFWGTTALVGCIAVISALYVAATRFAGNLVGERHRLPALFGHSIVPIALGYMVAHYYSLLIIEGQRAVIQLAYLPGSETNLLGLDTTDISMAWVHPPFVAMLQVVAVVTGHVVGAIAAHDRAVRLFPPAQATIGQLPLLILMVVYTYVGLTLLFAA